MREGSCCKNCSERTQMLSAGISLNQIIDAMTDPRKRLEFPVKPFTTEIELSTGTKATILGAAVLLSVALIYNATK